MSEDDAGRYVCQDADEFFNQDSVTVDVVESQPGRGGWDGTIPVIVISLRPSDAYMRR